MLGAKFSCSSHTLSRTQIEFPSIPVHIYNNQSSTTLNFSINRVKRNHSLISYCLPNYNSAILAENHRHETDAEVDTSSSLPS